MKRRGFSIFQIHSFLLNVVVVCKLPEKSIFHCISQPGGESGKTLQVQKRRYRDKKHTAGPGTYTTAFNCREKKEITRDSIQR